MKKFRKPKIKNLIIYLVIGFLYPLIKYKTATTGKMLIFLDSLTIVGFIYIIMGIFTAIYLHGDLDAISFRLGRGKRLSDNVSFETYKANKEKQREDSFNHPLFTGIFYILLSYVLATFCY